MKPRYPTGMGRWVAFAGIVLALGACGNSDNPAAGSPATPPPVPTATPAATLTTDQEIDAISQEIDRAELLWEGQAISNYRMTTAFLTYGADITVTVVVSDGKVIEHKCVPASTESNDDCGWAKYPKKYTVAGLFAELRHLRSEARQYPEYTPNEAMSVNYDNQLGYPRRIVWQPPEYTRWVVTSFERLP